MPVKTTYTEDKLQLEKRPGGNFRDRDAQWSQHRYTTDLHNKVWITAAAFHHDETLATDISWSRLGALGAWRFDETATDAMVIISTTLWRPINWINGTLQLDFLLADSTTNTGNLRIRQRVSSWAVGDTVSAVFDLFDNTETVASNSTANKLYQIQKTTTAFTTSSDVFGISFGRNPGNAADTATDDLLFYGVLVTYLPTNRQ